MKFLETEITNKEQVEKFFNKLHFHNMLFHPEDDPKDVVNIENIKVFTDEECKLLDKRLTECYEHHKDPCEYILENFSEYGQFSSKRNKPLISQVQIKELIENAEFLATSKRLESSLSSIDEAVEEWIYDFYALHFSESDDLFALFKQIIKKELFSQLSNNTKI